ncbi:MAG: AAA family ATPase [Defluviitaleaceae bacterium]|nr:AAA family ATPase [Defluviitaleaceae bacterium]
MNIGFYGHAKTMVFNVTSEDGKYKRQGLLGGIKQIYTTAKESIEAKETRLENMTIDPNSNEYRRDYFSISLCENANNEWYYSIDQNLGYEDGDSPDNIFCEMPEKSTDLLAVWDEGYGGLAPPEAENIFWASDKALPDKELFEKIAEKCFLLLDGKVLRNAGAMISRQISWERTASDLISEISSNPAISYLLKARYLMITFELDGAVFIYPKGASGQPEAALQLTHGDIEGAIGNKSPNQVGYEFIFLSMAATFFGSIVGLSAVTDTGALPEWKSNDILKEFMNTLVYAFSQDKQHSDIYTKVENDVLKWGTVLRTMLEAGETLTSILIRKGQGLFDIHDENLPTKHNALLRHWAAFPIPIESAGGAYKVPDGWTVINSVGNREIYDVAFEYVQKGSAAIDGLPQFKLGALTTVDRWEIESYQNIRNLILDYDANLDSKRPLSIAVFGAPGSGKSFGVTEIAEKVLPGKIEKLEFNVSQFISPMDLDAAFQKVRDLIVAGKLPLVFFDEFDSDKDGVALGWVKSFLMPMQDGKFRDESGEHPLGKCILVFAGGTAVSFEEFSDPMNREVGLFTSDKTIEQSKFFRTIKGPDFVSRLRGTINVVGPNPKDESDQNHILRRALLLRGLCERDRRIEKMQISPNIIRAMLLVPEFKHGVRSMEAILDMSRVEGGVWEPASLPFHSQLALHVDGDAFLQLVAKE